jgi:hypothetical protein
MKGTTPKKNGRQDAKKQTRDELEAMKTM